MTYELHLCVEAADNGHNSYSLSSKHLARIVLRVPFGLVCFQNEFNRKENQDVLKIISRNGFFLFYEWNQTSATQFLS